MAGNVKPKPVKGAYYKNNQNLPTDKAQFTWTQKEMRELDKCKRSILQFSKHFWIINLDEGRQAIKLFKFQKRMLQELQANKFNAMLTPRQMGKALALDTPIPTPKGFTTMGQLKDGDVVYDEEGNECNVVNAWETLYDRPCYEIEFNTGEKIVADENHLWKVDQVKIPVNTKFLFDTFNNQPLTINRGGNYSDKIEIVSITPTTSVPVRCITVDSPNNMFMCGKTFIPTHNTTVVTIFALWTICFQDDKRVILIANKQDTALNIFKRIRLAYENLPDWLKPGVVEWSKTQIELDNGSSIAIASTSEDSLRGESANVLIIDEAAHIQEHIIEGLWASVIPIISSSKKSSICIISTPNGTHNKFCQIYTDAERNKDGWNAVRVDWWEHPDRDEKWKDNMIKTLGSKQLFEQEFGNKFLDNKETAMDSQLWEDMYKKAKGVVPKFVDTQEGEYTIFEKRKEGHHYVLGVDSAEGVGANYSVIQVVDITDARDIRQVAVFASNTISPPYFASKVNDIARQWGAPPLMVESNNIGKLIINNLRNVHYYEHIPSYKPKAGKMIADWEQPGINSHNNSKSNGMVNMRYYLNTLRTVTINDLKTLTEFENYVKHANGSWKKRQGPDITDDRVEALLWALFVFDEQVAEQHYEIVERDSRGKILVLNPLYSLVDSQMDMSSPKPMDLKEYLLKRNGFIPRGMDELDENVFQSCLPSFIPGSDVRTEADDEIEAYKIQGWEIKGENKLPAKRFEDPVEETSRQEFWKNHNKISSRDYGVKKEGLLAGLRR